MSSADMPVHDRRFASRRPDAPRRVRHGLKLRQPLAFDHVLKSEAAPGGLPTLSHRWLARIERFINAQHLTDGLEYAKAGQIVDLDVKPGLVEAHVQGRAPRPYHTRLHVMTLSTVQWEQITNAMVAEAAYVAKLLAGELPVGFDELAGSLVGPDWLKFAEWSSGGESLDGAPASGCTCGESLPCKHVAAVGFLVAERLMQQPASMLTMLGMPADHLLDQLRRMRTIQSRGMASAHAEAFAPESHEQAPPLEACIDEYWRNPPGSGELADLENQAPLKHVPHALLRRLGPSPLSGRFPMVGLLASVYDAVSAAASKLRDSGAAPDEAPSPDSSETQLPQ